MSVADEYSRFVLGERRRSDVFRPGLVTAINKAVSPWLCQIEGRWMPFIFDALEVGDRVIWVDQDDPFAWSPLLEEEPEIPGSFTYFSLYLYGTITVAGGWEPSYLPDTTVLNPRSQYQPHPRVRESTFGTSQNWPWTATGLDPDIDAIFFGHFAIHEDHLRGEVDYLDATTLDEIHNWTNPTTLDPPERPYSDIPNLRPLVQNLDRAVTLWAGDAVEDIPPTSWVLKDYEPHEFEGLLSGPPVNGVQLYTSSAYAVFPAHSIREQILPTGLVDIVDGEPLALPRIDVPGPDWLMLWTIVIPPTWTNTATDTDPFAGYSSVFGDNVGNIATVYYDEWNVIYDGMSPGNPLPAELPGGVPVPPSPTPGFWPGWGEWEFYDAVFAEENYGFFSGRPRHLGGAFFSNYDMTDNGGIISVYGRSNRKLSADADADHYPYLLVDGLAPLLPPGDKHRAALFAFLLNTTAEDALK